MVGVHHRHGRVGEVDRDFLGGEARLDHRLAVAVDEGVVLPLLRVRALAAGVPVGQRLHEVALAADADVAGLLVVVEDDGRAQGGDMAVGTEAHLVLLVTVVPGLVVHGDLLGDFLGAAEAQHQGAHAAAAGVLQRLGVGAGQVHRRVRVLVGLGMDGTLGDLHEVAVMLDLVLHEHLRDQVHGFVDLRLQGGQVVAEGAGFLLGAALAHAEVHTALGQQVEGGDALGDFHRVVHRRRQADHAVADADALGFTGHESQHGFRRGHVRVVAQRGVFHAPEGVEAELVGEHGLLDGFVEDATVAFAAAVDRLCLVDQGEFHALGPCCS
ncbi:hypothetical protein D3C84_434450 [compost metagenome]